MVLASRVASRRSTRLILHAIHIGWNEFLSSSEVGWPSDRYSSILRIVAESDRFDLPFNQFFQSHVFGLYGLAQGDISSSNLGLAKSVDQFFFLVDVSFGWVWLNSTHLFFFFFNAPVAVLSSGGISGLKAIRFGYLEFRWNALDEGGNGKYLFLKLLCIIYAFDFIFFTFSNFSKQVFSQVLIN